MITDKKRLFEAAVLVVTLTSFGLASSALYVAKRTQLVVPHQEQLVVLHQEIDGGPIVAVPAGPDGGRRVGNAYPYVDMQGRNTILANPPLGHIYGGTDVTSTGANGNVLTSNAGFWTSAPPSGGGFVCSNLSSCTGGQLPTSGIADGTPNSLLATDNAGVVAWKGITPGGDLTLSTPITGSSIPFMVIGWNTIPLTGTAPTNGQLYIYNSGSNNWSPGSYAGIAGIPIPVISGANHGAATNIPTTYGALASLSLTVPSGAVATIDCHASIEWQESTGAGGSHTLSWGISQNSSASPSHVRQLGFDNALSGGAMVEGYPGTSTGTYTYRVLAQDPTTTGVSIGIADLVCIQH